MDSLYTEGELMQPFNDFHHGHYQKVLDFPTDDLSSEATQPFKILRLRAQIASGQADAALSEVKSSSEPDLAAVRALALYTSGKTAEGVKEAESLSTSSPEDATVQILAGIVLAAEARNEEALALLSKHQGSLEAAALSVQIHLSQNRTDLALKEVQAAKKWAQDSLLVNLADSWVGLRLGGDRYQQAFYEFEEMPVAQSVAEIHLGRLPEAEAALQNALKEEPESIPAIANSVVLNVLAGKDTAELTRTLQEKAPSHALLADLKEKSEAFDHAALKYSAKA